MSKISVRKIMRLVYEYSYNLSEFIGFSNEKKDER